MNSIFFIVDESGAKGYSDNKESVRGELGVMAGFLIPEDELKLIEAELDSIKNNFIINEKLHITDLPPTDQESLRKQIFEYFMNKNIRWVYEAIYVEGFYEQSESAKKMAEKIKKGRRSKVKLSSNVKYESLHSELFCGAFGKGIAYCMENVGNKFNLKVITDRIDNTILQLFISAADSLINIAPKQDKITGYDPDTSQVVSGEVTSRVLDTEDDISYFQGVTYTIEIDDSALTLAADVLANSVHYHLKERQKETVGQYLNTKGAIHGHVLGELVYGVFETDNGNSIADSLYMHTESIAKLNSDDS